jgi:hypothetical protein
VLGVPPGGASRFYTRCGTIFFPPHSPFLFSVFIHVRGDQGANLVCFPPLATCEISFELGCDGGEED